MKPQSFEELVQRYGKPWESESSKLTFEKAFMTLWRADNCENNECLAPNSLPVRRIYCHRDLVPVLDKAMLSLSKGGFIGELKTFDGCWNIRAIRGQDAIPEERRRWSIHSFGLAVDLNAEQNPLGGPVKFTPEFLSVMRGAGFTCGADFRRLDGMHFQWADNC